MSHTLHPDLRQLLLAKREQPLWISLGWNERSEILTVSLPELTPLLILARSADEQKRLVLAWLAQLTSKRSESSLRLALLEGPGDQRLTRFLQEYSLATVTAGSIQGLLEAIWVLEGTIERRLAEMTFSQPWLIILELSDRLALPMRAETALQTLLARGSQVGLYFIVLAHQEERAAFASPDLFAATIVLEASSSECAELPDNAGFPRATLHRWNIPGGVRILIPPIHPEYLRPLLEQGATSDQISKDPLWLYD